MSTIWISVPHAVSSNNKTECDSKIHRPRTQTNYNKRSKNLIAPSKISFMYDFFKLLFNTSNSSNTWYSYNDFTHPWQVTASFIWQLHYIVLKTRAHLTVIFKKRLANQFIIIANSALIVSFAKKPSTSFLKSASLFGSSQSHHVTQIDREEEHF